MMAAGLLTATSAMAIGSQDNNDALIQDATTSNETAPNAAQPKKSNSNDYEKWRIGSYGEMLATFKDYGLNRFYGNSVGNTKINHNEISIPRFILQGEYKITPKWILSAEIEFEAGGTGSAVEMEAQSGSENGEYETEMEKVAKLPSNNSTSPDSSLHNSMFA